jgi:polar amino acid transport system substrate-binding protein
MGLALWLGMGAGCSSGGSRDARGPAPLDSARVPIDTPPTAAQPTNPPEKREEGPRVSQAEYEGWRQYSVNCARCHGQDVLPNPVAANLLTSLAAGGPIDTPEKFGQVVHDGRPHRGMPAFKDILSPEQTQAIYAYVKGRADKRISPGRPAKPTG